MSDVRETHVVTCFLRAEGEVLLLKRSNDVGSYPGAWGAVAGHAEGDPDDAARREIREETGFDDAQLVRKGEPFPVDDPSLNTRWIVHPYLFDVSRRDPSLNYESVAAQWASPTAIMSRQAVPRLWDSYRAVAPTLEVVREDRIHGSTYLSLRALEVLRDRAAEGAALGELRTTAGALISARASMAAVRNRIDRAMHEELGRPDRGRSILPEDDERPVSPKGIHEVLRRAVEADREASRVAAAMVRDKTALVLSESGTVTNALLESRPRVVIAASHPGGEGVGAARKLGAAGLDVTLIPDALLASAPPFDLVLLGCDALLPDGTVVNKVGSKLAAIVARHRDVPVYTVTSIDKLLVDADPEIPQADPGEIGDVSTELVHVATDLFERVPARLVDRYATEHGMLEAGRLEDFVEELRASSAWRSGGTRQT